MGGPPEVGYDDQRARDNRPTARGPEAGAGAGRLRGLRASIGRRYGAIVVPLSACFINMGRLPSSRA